MLLCMSVLRAGGCGWVKVLIRVEVHKYVTA